MWIDKWRSPKVEEVNWGHSYSTITSNEINFLIKSLQLFTLPTNYDRAFINLF